MSVGQDRTMHSMVQQALNERLARNLRPILAGSGFLFAFFTISHLLVLAPRIALPMAAVSAGSTLVLWTLWWYLGDHPAPARLAHPLAAFIALIIFVDCLLHLYLSEEPWQTTNLLLLILGLSILFTSRRWFFGALSVIATGWAVVALSSRPDSLWLHYAFAFFIATVLSIVINTIQIRSLRQVETLRLGLEQKVREQTGELRSANDELRKTESALRRQAARLAALNRTGHAVSSSLSRGELVKNLLDEISSTIQPDLTLFFLLEEEELKLAGQKASEEELEKELPVHRVGECLCGLAAAEASPVYCTDIHSDSRCPGEEGRKAGFTSFAAIPLVADEEVLGILGLASRAERDFSRENDFFEALSGTVVTGLRNSLLYERLQENSAELEESVEEYRRSEEERKSLQARLIHAQKMEAIATLSGGIAHDFNNILSAIIGYAELAKTEVEAGTPLDQDLSEILTGAGRAADLVKQILTFSRPQESRQHPVEFGLIVKEAIKFARATLPSSIQIVQNVKSRAVVMADPTHLHQLVMNLCANAGHAMADRGGTLSIKLSDVDLNARFVAVHPGAIPGSYVKLVLADSGYGIPAGAIERIFDPYFTTKEPGEGTGLGLSVVHGIATAYRGIVSVSSREKEGTTFSVFLPTVELAGDREPESPAAMPGGTERLLLVEDEAMVRGAVAALLGRLGYRVTSCGNGVEALSIFEASPEDFDLVLTDLTMPKMRGDELALRLYQIRPGIPIILCTGYGKSTIDQDELDKIVAASLTKPIQIGQWAVTIREVLDKEPGDP